MTIQRADQIHGVIVSANFSLEIRFVTGDTAAAARGIKQVANGLSVVPGAYDQGQADDGRERPSGGSCH